MLLVGAAGVADDQLHGEAVHLRLRERVDALALDRVLGGEDEERPRHRVGLAGDAGVPLAHHLQQRGLHLGGRPVDLVGQHEVGEDGPEASAEVAGGVEDLAADHVGGHEVGRELDAAEAAAAHAGDGLERQRLREAGDALQEHVPA